MSIFDCVREKKEGGFEKIGTWKKLRTGLYSCFDYKNKWYLLKKREVVHQLNKEDCAAILKDLMELENDG
jgi:hypothetical protein